MPANTISSFYLNFFLANAFIVIKKTNSIFRIRILETLHTETAIVFLLNFVKQFFSFLQEFNMSNLVIGWVGIAVAVLFFGSNFIPIKKYETGDGMFFQFVVCTGRIWIWIWIWICLL